MGGVKQMQIEKDELYICKFLDKLVCKNHFGDVFINNFISSISFNGVCDYCNEDTEVSDFNNVLKFIMTSICRFYGDSNNIGSHFYDTLSVQELMEEVGLIANSKDLISDIGSCISDINWCNPDSFYGSEVDDINYLWSHFTHSIKHVSRFLFNINDNEEIRHSFKTLEYIGKLIDKFKLVNTLKAGEILYRCHQHKKGEGRKGFKGLISAPDDKSITSNRFSPAGISMFYCSNDNEVSILEIIGENKIYGSYITSGKFQLLQDVNIIDFNKLPDFPSFFGVKYEKEFYTKAILHYLVESFTSPIKHDGKEHVDYVPTQVVTEYFRYSFNSKRKDKIHGLVYPSAKDKRRKSMVLFWNHDDCFGKVKLLSESVSNIKIINDQIVKLMYRELNINDYRVKKNDASVYKLELYSSSINSKHRNPYYIQLLTISKPFDIGIIAEDLLPSCNTFFVWQNSKLVSNIIK